MNIDSAVPSAAPESVPSRRRPRALFFSRGRGHGHAMPDLALVAECRRQQLNVDFEFASYATGAATFRDAGHEVYNLGLPENNGFLETLFKARDLIARARPDVVLSHEEFAALPAAHLAGIPAIFLSAWFPPEGHVRAESLAYASSIIIIEDPGLFPTPSGLTTRPIYVGPILRQMQFTVADRPQLRAALNVPADAVMIVVLTGGSATEKTMPLAETILSSFLALKAPAKRLFWLSAPDFELMKSRTAGFSDVEVLPFVDPVEKILAAADVVITKGTQLSTLDCATLGVPSISLSPGMNPIDDTLIPRLGSNIALNARAVDASILSYYLHRVLARRTPVEPLRRTGLSAAAHVLKTELDRLLAQPPV